MGKLTDRLLARWIACSVIPDKESVRYGIYFSYPVYLLLVLSGILLSNPYILLVTATIAFLGIKLPMHPFDYIYNYAAKLIGANKIPGRGSELQVNSIVAVVFSLIVFALIAFNVSLNFEALAIIYTLSNVFFIGVLLFRD